MENRSSIFKTIYPTRSLGGCWLPCPKLPGEEPVEAMTAWGSACPRPRLATAQGVNRHGQERKKRPPSAVGVQRCRPHPGNHVVVLSQEAEPCLCHDLGSLPQQVSFSRVPTGRRPIHRNL